MPSVREETNPTWCLFKDTALVEWSRMLFAGRVETNRFSKVFLQEEFIC